MVDPRTRRGRGPQIRAALDENAEGGEYYGPTGFQEFKGPPGKVPQLPYALDEAHQDRLWEISKEATGAVFPWEGQGTSRPGAPAPPDAGGV